MKFWTTLDQLDDKSGTLRLELAKLRIEQMRGIPCEAQEAGFVENLYHAVLRKEVRPWKVGATVCASLAAVLFLGSGLLPLVSDLPGAAITGLRVLAGVAFTAAILGMVNHSRHQSELEARYENYRSALEGGMSIFDLEDAQGF